MIINNLRVAGVGAKGPFLEAQTDSGKVRIVTDPEILRQAADEIEKWQTQAASYQPRYPCLEPHLQKF